MHLTPGSIEDSRLSSESCWLLLCAYVGESMLVRKWWWPLCVQGLGADAAADPRPSGLWPLVPRVSWGQAHQEFLRFKISTYQKQITVQLTFLSSYCHFLCFLSSSVYFGIFFNKFGCWWCWPSMNLFFQCFFLTDFNENVGCLLVF